MSQYKLQDISNAMRKIDICMMATNDGYGGLESRPMSNNKDVDYDGDSWFYALEDASAVRHLKQNPKICLSYEGKDNLYISISGEAYTTQRKEELKAHWVPDLDQWFEDGVDTEGLTLIHVNGEHIHYWQDREDGEIKLKSI